MLSIEGVLALHHAGMHVLSQVPGRLPQGQGQVQVRHCGKLDGGILHAGMLKTHRAGGYHDIPAAHLQGDAAAGTAAEEGIRPQVVQLLHGDGGGRPADARGADADLLPFQISGPDVVFPVLRHLGGTVEHLRHCGRPPGISGQNHIASHIPGTAANVKLFLHLLHMGSSFQNDADDTVDTNDTDDTNDMAGTNGTNDTNDTDDTNDTVNKKTMQRNR